jgi:hypothetical protein
MREGIFTKIKEFFLGENRIEEYGGDVGGYRYIILYDKSKDEIISHYITPPKKYSRSIGGRLDALGASVGVNYQSEYYYDQTFAVVNKDATLSNRLDELESKINEGRAITEPQIRASKTLELRKDEKFIAGSYVTSAASNIIKEPNFEAHFEEISLQIKAGLLYWLEFITEVLYVQTSKSKKSKKEKIDSVFRSSIFLPDAIKRELKMQVSYNTARFSDNMISFPFDRSFVSYVFGRKEIMFTDTKASRADSYGDMSGFPIWKDLRSILAFPILDTNLTCLGVLSIDTNLPYTNAGFDRQGLNDMVFLITKGIGTVLEGYR